MIRILVLLLCLGLAGHAHAQGGFDADALAFVNDQWTQVPVSD